MIFPDTRVDNLWLRMSRHRHCSDICLSNVRGGTGFTPQICRCTCPRNTPTSFSKTTGVNNLCLGRSAGQFRTKLKKKGKCSTFFPDNAVNNRWLCMSRQSSNMKCGGRGCTCPGNIPTISLKEVGVHNLWLRVSAGKFFTINENGKGPNGFCPDIGLAICGCACPDNFPTFI